MRHLSLQHSRHFVYLCSVEDSWSLPPSTVAHVSSQQTWVGSTRRDQEYLQRGCGKRAGGQVEHLLVQEKGGAMKTRELTKDLKWTDMHRLTIRTCLQNLRTRQKSTQSILVAQPCIPMKVLMYLVCFGGV